MTALLSFCFLQFMQRVPKKLVTAERTFSSRLIFFLRSLAYLTYTCRLRVVYEMRERMKVNWDLNGYDLLVGTNTTFSYGNRNATKILELNPKHLRKELLRNCARPISTC